MESIVPIAATCALLQAAAERKGRLFVLSPGRRDSVAKMPFEIPIRLYRGFGHLKAQVVKFAHDSRRTPSRVGLAGLASLL